MSPVRYSAPGLEVVGCSDGHLVLFADIEPALRDSEMLDWLLPLVSGENTPLADRRTDALGAGLIVGLTGRDLVTYAMEGCP